MSRETKLAKNTIILSIGTFLPRFASFITLPILTAYLSKEQYGVYDLITILASLLLPVTTLLISAASFRFLIERNRDIKSARLYFSNSTGFMVPMSLFALTVLYFLLPIKSSSLKLWICIYLFFDALVSNVRQIARGMSKNIYYSISAIISALIKIIFALLLVRFLQYELLGAVVALAMSSFASFLFIAFKIRAHELFDPKLINLKTIKKMLAYSWPMVPNNLSGWVIRVSDRLIISIFMGLADNAVYAVANKMPSLLMMAQSAFSMAWQESASIASSNEDVDKYYSRMFTVMNNFYSGCLGLIIALTPMLFKILVRRDYSDAYPQMSILFLAVFFHCMSSFLGGIYIAFKKTRSVGLTTIAAAIVNLAVNGALIKFIGLFAASGSTLVSYMFLFFFRVYDVRKFVKIKYNVLKFSGSICVLMFESVLCLINTRTLNIVNLCVASTAFFFLNREIAKKIIKKLK